MISTFTQEDLLLFIYGEAEHRLENEIKKALHDDLQVQQCYNQLLETIKKIDSFLINPDETSCKIIIEESSITKGEKLVS